MTALHIFQTLCLDHVSNTLLRRKLSLSTAMLSHRTVQPMSCDCSILLLSPCSLCCFSFPVVEISSRKPSGPVMPTGDGSPLSTITTCSGAASWWSCCPSCSTCYGCGAFTTGCSAAALPAPSGWRKAFPPRRLPVPHELPPAPSQKIFWRKSHFASGFLFCFPPLALFFLPSILQNKTQSIVVLSCVDLCCPRDISASFCGQLSVDTEGKGKSLQFGCMGLLGFLKVCSVFNRLHFDVRICKEMFSIHRSRLKSKNNAQPKNIFRLKLYLITPSILKVLA